jgi:glycosyltransferase involved in cell wall biosynthesis
MDSRFLGNYAPFPIVPNLTRTIGRLGVDIVSVSEYTSLPTWLFSMHKGGWKTVLTQHGYGRHHTFRDHIYDYLTRKLLARRVDGFVAIGMRARRFLEELGARNVTVIPNPIDDTLFKPLLPYHERDNSVLFVGRADTRRRLHVVLNAIRDVRRRITNAKLLVIGDKGDMSSRLPRDGCMEYLGPKPHLDMPRYYNLARVFVSAVRGEAGCGCALEEALACGTPVIGTTDLDFPFPWKDGKVGYVVEPNQTGLARGIVQALQDGARLHGNCRDVAVKEFSRTSVGRRYSQVFEDVLSK